MRMQYTLRLLMTAWSHLEIRLRQLYPGAIRNANEKRLLTFQTIAAVY